MTTWPMEKHEHHWVPTRTGKYNAQREPIMEMKCMCGMSLAEFQWIEKMLADAPPVSEADRARLARLLGKSD